MKQANWLRWIWVIMAVVLSGCASTSFKEDAQALLPDQATVFGKVTLIKEGHQQKLNFLGDTILRLVVRGENDSETLQYAVRDPGYFFWNLPPGRYMIIGYVVLLERGPIRMEFVVPPGSKALYLGDLTISFRGDLYQVDHKDKFASATEAFKKKFPTSQIMPERAKADMEKPLVHTAGSCRFANRTGDSSAIQVPSVSSRSILGSEAAR